MDSLRRKCFDCKHYIDVAVADTLGDGVIGSKFGFYRRSAAAAVDRRSSASRSTGSIRVADKSARCAIDRSHFEAAIGAVAVAVGAVTVDSGICWALCEL